MYRNLLAFGLVFSLISGCTSSNTDSVSTGSAAEFERCVDADSLANVKGSLCTSARVPLHYQSDSSDTVPDSINMFVRKFPALEDSEGSVWMLAGGPGQSGAMFYPFIETIREAFPGYDILIPDHRGTGLSSRICPEEETVSSPGESQLRGREWTSCYEYMRSNPEYVRSFSITNAARDIENLMKQFNAGGKRYLFGISYGTQLAHRILVGTDVELDGLILDSLVPMQRDTMWTEIQRHRVTDAVGHQVLARCDNDPKCNKRLGGDALGKYKDVLRKVENGNVDLPDAIPNNDLKTFLGQLLDIPEARDQIPKLIESLSNNEYNSVDTVMDILRKQSQQFDYPGFALSVPLSNTILNSENNLQPNLTTKELSRQKEELEFSHNLPFQMVASLNADLPLYKRDKFWEAHPDTIPPTLILHGTLDPKTHYQGSRRHAERLEKAGNVGLVSVRDAPHAILMRSPDCFVRHVSKFITSGKPEEAWCESKKAHLDFTVTQAEGQM